VDALKQRLKEQKDEFEAKLKEMAADKQSKQEMAEIAYQTSLKVTNDMMDLLNSSEPVYRQAGLWNLVKYVVRCMLCYVLVGVFIEVVLGHTQICILLEEYSREAYILRLCCVALQYYFLFCAFVLSGVQIKSTFWVGKSDHSTNEDRRHTTHQLQNLKVKPIVEQDIYERNGYHFWFVPLNTTIRTYRVNVHKLIGALNPAVRNITIDPAEKSKRMAMFVANDNQINYNSADLLSGYDSITDTQLIAQKIIANRFFRLSE